MEKQKNLSHFKNISIPVEEKLVNNKKLIKSTVLFRSSNKNNYIFDLIKRSFFLTHPILFFILSIEQKGQNIEEWLEQSEGTPLQVDNYGLVSKDEYNYYYQKYKFLREHGLSSNIDNSHKLDKELTSEIVENSLVNTKQITLEVTDGCNLECEYCGYGKYYGNYDNRQDKFLSFSTVKSLLKYMSKLWNSPLNDSRERNIFLSFYGGEPLLNFSLIDKTVSFVRSLNLKHNNIIFSMTTNGILLNRYMDFLVKNNFSLLISLDGDEIANGYRVLKNGKPSFQKIMKNIDGLRIRYPKFFENNVNFNAVLHNKNSAPGVYNFFKNTFNKMPRIGTLNTAGIKTDMEEEFWKTYAVFDESKISPEIYSSMENDLFIKLPNIQDLSTFIHNYNNVYYKDYNDLIYRNNNYSRIPTGTCLPFSQKIFITVNGKILPCERIGQEFSLGYIDEDEVNIDFNEIALKYNNWFNRIKNICHLCYRSEYCSQCIFQMKGLSNNPRCNGFYTYSSFSDYLSKNINKIEKDPTLFYKIYNNVVIE